VGAATREAWSSRPCPVLHIATENSTSEVRLMTSTIQLLECDPAPVFAPLPPPPACSLSECSHPKGMMVTFPLPNAHVSKETYKEAY
jgi:hypothetical protein